MFVPKIFVLTTGEKYSDFKYEFENIFFIYVEHHLKVSYDSYQSIFYSCYPSRESKQSESHSHKDLLKRIFLFIACTFNLLDNNILIKDVDQGSFLFITKLDKEKLTT